MHPDYRYIYALHHGDDYLIQEIYALHAETIIAWIEKNGGNAADAKDVMQDALMTIARQSRRPGWQLTCPFGAYLFLVCKGKWLNELKRRRRAEVTKFNYDGLPDEDAQALAEITLLAEKRDRLFWQKFEELGSKCRQLLRLAWEGQPLEGVAKELGMSYAYVRKKKSKCIARLTASIKNDPDFELLKTLNNEL